MRRKRGDTCSRPAVRQEPLPGRRCRMNLFRAGGAGYMRDGRPVTPGLSDVGVEKGGRQETGSRSRGFLDAIFFFFSMGSVSNLLTVKWCRTSKMFWEPQFLGAVRGRQEVGDRPGGRRNVRDKSGDAWWAPAGPQRGVLNLDWRVSRRGWAAVEEEGLRPRPFSFFLHRFLASEQRPACWWPGHRAAGRLLTGSCPGMGSFRL